MKNINFIGTVTKEEHLSILNNLKTSQILVFDVPNPLSSYYDRFTNIHKLHTVIIVTKADNSFRKILSATKKINKSHGLDVLAGSCSLRINTKNYNGIRLKGENVISNLDKLITSYKEEGFEFLVNKKIKASCLALITIDKFFNMDELAPNIFKSNNNENVYYLKLSKAISWNNFYDIINRIDTETMHTDFSFAKATLYNQDDIFDAVRIAKSKIDIETVQKLEVFFKS